EVLLTKIQISSADLHFILVGTRIGSPSKQGFHGPGWFLLEDRQPGGHEIAVSWICGDELINNGLGFAFVATHDPWCEHIQFCQSSRCLRILWVQLERYLSFFLETLRQRCLFQQPNAI